MADVFIAVTLEIKRETLQAKSSASLQRTLSVQSAELDVSTDSVVSINEIKSSVAAAQATLELQRILSITSGTSNFNTSAVVGEHEIKRSPIVAYGKATIGFTRVHDILSVTVQGLKDAIVSEEEIKSRFAKTYVWDITDEIPIVDYATFDGIGSNDYIDEPIHISDEVETSPINFLLEMDDTITITDKNFNVELFDDFIKMYDGLATLKFTGETQKIVAGTQFYLSSQHPSPGTLVNVFKRYSHPIMVDFFPCLDTVELIHRRSGEIISDETIDGGSIPTGEEPLPTFLPNGNLPDLFTIAGPNGEFCIKGLSLGVYVFVSLEKGYTLGWKKVDVVSDMTTTDLFLAPIQSWNYVERIYNIYGHTFKMYHVSNFIDEADGNRVVDGILVFGDLYGEGAQGNATEIDSSGYLEIDTTVNPGRLYLMDMPDLGKQGFFDRERGEQVWSNEECTRITWNGGVRPHEFDGFAFRMRFPPDSSGILNLSLATGYKVPMPYGNGSSVGGSSGGGGGGSSGRSGSWGTGLSPGAAPRAYENNASGIVGGSSQYSPANPPPPYVPPPWNPNFAVSLLDGFSVFEEDMRIRVQRGGIYIEQLNLLDAVQVDEDFGTPPTLTMTGMAADEAGNPIVGATIHLVAVRNGVVVGSTTSGANGVWSISNLESEFEYRVVVSAPLLGFQSTSAKIQVYDRDIVDNRAWQILEAQAYNDRGAGTSQFLDSRIILPPMRLKGLVDGRIWGEVTDAGTGTSLGGILVEAYPGWLDEGELNLYAAQMKSDTTGSRSMFVPGYYEIYVTKGKWTVRARKGSYAKSEIYYVELQAGFNLDIPIVGQSVEGLVYDRDHFNATGEKIPIAGAVVTLEGYQAVTDASGTFKLVAAVERDINYIIECSAKGFSTEKRNIKFVGTDSISGV